LWQNSKLYGAKVTFAEDREPLVLNYLYDGDEVIGVYLNGKILLYIKNIQGDIISVVNTENNEIVLNYYYDAWGNVSYEASDSIAGAIVSVLVLATTNFSYRGYFCDHETGLYYLQSRYYDPEVGRFINLDDPCYLFYDITQVIESNLFAYCCNNPVNRIDPTGFFNNWLQETFPYILVSIYGISISGLLPVFASAKQLYSNGFTEHIGNEKIYYTLTTALVSTFWQSSKYEIISFGAEISAWREVNNAVYDLIAVLTETDIIADEFGFHSIATSTLSEVLSNLGFQNVVLLIEFISELYNLSKFVVAILLEDLGAKLKKGISKSIASDVYIFNWYIKETTHVLFNAQPREVIHYAYCKMSVVSAIM
jgi:RHS repeat-associated protein